MSNAELLDTFFDGLVAATNQGPEFFTAFHDEYPNELPPMVPAPDGEGSLPVTMDGIVALQQWSESVFNNNPALRERITRETWHRVVQRNALRLALDEQAVAQSYGESHELTEIAKVSSYLQRSLINLVTNAKDTIHFFPAWYADTPLTCSVDLGPVALLPPSKVSSDVESYYDDDDERDEQRTELLRSRLENASHSATCVAYVRLSGRTTDKARQLAQAISRLSLSALLLPHSDGAIEHARFDDDPAPARARVKFSFGSNKITLPGHTLSMVRIKKGDWIAGDQDQWFSIYRSALAKILWEYVASGIESPACWQCPGLGQKFLWAIHWMDRGFKAPLDGEAVSHFGTALNVICDHQSATEVKKTTAKLLGVSPDVTFSKSPVHWTVGQLAKDLYAKCRSKILHGNRDIFKEEFEQRALAGVLVRLTLLHMADHLILHEATGGEDSLSSLRATTDSRATKPFSPDQAVFNRYQSIVG